MPWNPEIYNQFKAIRFQPFFDLSDLIQNKGSMKCIDLGCGTGEQTGLLAEKFPDADFTGIDASIEMLKNSSKLEHSRLRFRNSTTEEILEGGNNWDLIFSNAALQWSDNHTELIPGLIRKLNPGGQLAVQMPYQPGNILNVLLAELASEEPYCSQLGGWNRESSVLTLDAYTQLMFDNGLENLNLFQKVYPIVAPDVETLFNFISGSALIPYLEKLNNDQAKVFCNAFRQKIAGHFTQFPAVYPFKRLLLYGRKGETPVQNN